MAAKHGVSPKKINHHPKKTAKRLAAKKVMLAKKTGKKRAKRTKRSK